MVWAVEGPKAILRGLGVFIGDGKDDEKTAKTRLPHPRRSSSLTPALPRRARSR
jgi:hypothetical protein